jgi:transposase
MARYVEGRNRCQRFLLPESVDDYVDENNPVRAVEVFVDALDLAQLGFGRAVPADTGRPSYHPSTMLKIYLYGYLNRIQSSRRLEREAGRNLELMWLTGRLAPDFKTIADFRRDNGPAIRAACSQFVAPCRAGVRSDDERGLRSAVEAAGAADFRLMARLPPTRATALASPLSAFPGWLLFPHCARCSVMREESALGRRRSIADEDRACGRTAAHRSPVPNNLGA